MEACLEGEGVMERDSVTPGRDAGERSPELPGYPGLDVQQEQRTLCKGACPPGVAPPIPAFPHPLVCPSSWPGGFAFSHQLERSSGTRAPGARAGATDAPMAPFALWVALVVELQLWAIGHTVPSQVGDSWGHGGQLRITKCPSQLLHNSGTAQEAIPSPADTRHAPLGTHWGRET